MKLKGQINNWNLKKKITFFLTIIILVTSIIIMVTSAVSATYYITNQSKNMAKTQLSMIASNYAETLKQYQELAVAMVIEDSVQQYCKSDESSGPAYEVEAGAVYNYLLGMLNVRSNINFAVVEKTSINRYIYKGNSSVFDAKFDMVYQKDYKRSNSSKEGSTVKMSFGNNYFRDGKGTLTIYHPIYSTSVINEQNGMLVINFNDTLIEQFYEKDVQNLNSELFLTDCDGNIVSVSNEERMQTKVPYLDQIQGNRGSFQDDGMLINYQKVGDWNYYLVNEIPVFELYRDMAGMMAILVMVILGIMVASIAALRRMMRSFYEPLNRVVTAMDDVAEGKLDERIEMDMKRMDADSRKLAGGFNSMMDKIDILMEQVKTEQHQIEQIRFNALQSQIKPHFLYNTLECIHWQAVSDGNKEISVMVKALAQYYRLCLSRGKEIIPLKQEMEHVRSYLIIQNMRYDNIIEFEEQIENEFYEVQIPKMTLQPLIENAIYHGIRVKEGKCGKVLLTVRKEDGDVYLSVCDSGTGMSQKEIDAMNQSISQYDETFGYGVRNVNRRIELMFGIEYGLRFFQNEHGGVTVEIHLPLEGKTEDKGVI